MSVSSGPRSLGAVFLWGGRIAPHWLRSGTISKAWFQAASWFSSLRLKPFEGAHYQLPLQLDNTDPLLVSREERMLGSFRFLEHCRTSPGNPPRPRATALTKAFPVVALSVTRLFRCVLFGSRLPSACSDPPPTDTSLRASSSEPFEMRAIRTGRRPRVPAHERFYRDRRCCLFGARLRGLIWAA